MSRAYQFLAALFLLLVLAPPVHAEPKPYYFQLGLGPQWREPASDSAGSITFDTGFAVNAAAGFRTPWWVRAEFEGAYFSNNLDTLTVKGSVKRKADGEVTATSLFGNLYVDIPLKQIGLTPYLGGGVGSYKISVDGLTNDDLRQIPLAIYSDSSWTFAWQLRAGASYALNQNVDLLLGYRYFHGQDTDMVNPVGQVLHPNMRLHNMEIGVRYNF